MEQITINPIARWPARIISVQCDNTSACYFVALFNFLWQTRPVRFIFLSLDFSEDSHNAEFMQKVNDYPDGVIIKEIAWLFAQIAACPPKEKPEVNINDLHEMLVEK